jgi:hypothetical protein
MVGMSMIKVIGVRAQPLRAVIFPMGKYLLVFFPLIIFKEEIINLLNMILGQGSIIVDVVYYGLLASWTIFIFYFEVLEYLIDFFHVLRMPKDLVGISDKGIFLAKPVEIMDNDTKDDILKILVSNDSLKLLSAKDVSLDDIWEEDFIDEIIIEYDDFYSIGVVINAKNVEKALNSNKLLNGDLIIISKKGKIYAQPKIHDIKLFASELEKIIFKSKL